MEIGGVLLLLAGLFVALLPLILYVVVLQAIIGVRDAVQRQTEVIETIGRNAGWLPQRPPKR